MSDFTVTFDLENTFDVNFSLQGPRGESGSATLYDAATTYDAGDFVYNSSGNFFGSLQNDNLGNALSDTNFWTELSLADSLVTELDDLSDVDLDTLQNNQVLTYNSTTSEWMNEDPQGGPTPHPNAVVAVAVNPEAIEQGFNSNQTVTFTVTVTPTSEFSFGSMTAKASEGTISIVDGIGTLTIPAANNTPHNINVDFDVSYTQDSDSSPHSETIRGTVHIERGFYTSVTINQPAAIDSMTNEGVWTGSNEQSWTPTGSTRELYYAMPTRSDGYSFEYIYNGQFLSFASVTDLGTISTDYTLYRIDDYDDSASLPLNNLTVRNA